MEIEQARGFAHDGRVAGKYAHIVLRFLHEAAVILWTNFVVYVIYC